MTALLRSLVHTITTMLEAITARTATFNGTAFDALDYEGTILVVQSVGVVSGTTPTLDGKIQESDTSGGTYTDIAAATFTQVTATNSWQSLKVDIQMSKRFIRYVGTISGSTPSFTMGCAFVGIKKYQ